MNTPWVRSCDITIPIVKQVGAREENAWGNTYLNLSKPDRKDTFTRRGMLWDEDIQPILDHVDDPEAGPFEITDHNGMVWSGYISSVGAQPNDSEGGGSQYFTVTLEMQEAVRVTP